MPHFNVMLTELCVADMQRCHEQKCHVVILGNVKMSHFNVMLIELCVAELFHA